VQEVLWHPACGLNPWTLCSSDAVSLSMSCVSLSMGVSVSSLPVDRGAPSRHCIGGGGRQTGAQRQSQLPIGGGGTEIEANLVQGWALDL
jgi:hypothetical protein